MARMLENGTTRKIGGGALRNYVVIAERIDEDTPYIHIQDKFTGTVFLLTDSDARQLADDIKKALQILPTSK